VLALAAATALPAPARAESIPRSKPWALSQVPAELLRGAFDADPLRGAKPPAAREGQGPWKLFAGAVAEALCHAPLLSQDGSTALAVCPGLDATSPADPHVILADSGRPQRWPRPLARLGEGESAREIVALSPDGRRFAALVDWRGARAPHLVDRDAGLEWRITGPWQEPNQLALAPDARALAFVATLQGKAAVLLVRIEDAGGAAGTAAETPQAPPQATVVWTGDGPVRLFGLSEGARRVLLAAPGSGGAKAQLAMIDVEAGQRVELSSRKQRVDSAVLHGAGDAVVFAGGIGGVCAMWWAEPSLRKRTTLLSSSEACYHVISLDEPRRHVLYGETISGGTAWRVRDRKAGELRYELVKGCVEPALSADGRFMATRCPKARIGAGSYVFPLPEPLTDDEEEGGRKK
jgi:hypothetical protein